MAKRGRATEQASATNGLGRHLLATAQSASHSTARFTPTTVAETSQIVPHAACCTSSGWITSGVAR
jgi:hypothetical protein